VDGGGGANIRTIGDDSTDNVLSNAEFNHVVAVYNNGGGGGGDDLMTLYVNGVEVGTHNSANSGWTGGDNAALGGRSGGLAQGVSGGTDMEGDLAVYRFYTRALSAGDVEANRQATLNPADPNFDGDPLTVTQVEGLPVNVGNSVLLGSGDTITVNADGSFTFTPGDNRFDVLDAGETSTDAGLAEPTLTYGTIEGGTATVTLQMTGVNDAPTVDDSGAPTLTTIDEDATTNNGNTVQEILTGVADDPDGDHDVDGTNQNVGLALIGTSQDASLGAGKWEYSLDGGSSWNDVGAVTATTALLLENDDRLRFLPDTIDGGTATLTYRAWDRSDGSTAGDVVNLDGVPGGGTTAYSTASETSTLTITEINDGIDAVDDRDPIDGSGADNPFVANTSSVITGNLFADNENGPDTDPDGAAFFVDSTNLLNVVDNGTTITGDTPDQGAAVTITKATGDFQYDGTPQFGNGGGPDSFTYTISDAGSDPATATDTATVYFSLLDLEPPVVTNDSYAVDMDAGLDNGVLTVSSGDPNDLLDNDGPGADGTSIFLVKDVSDTASTAGAAITYTGAGNTGDGGFTYDASNAALPDALAEGETFVDTFDYIVENDVGVRSTGTASVTITGDGAVTIDLTKDMPPSFSATIGAGTDDNVELSESGGQLQVTVNGEVLRDPADIGSFNATPDVAFIGTGSDSETVTFEDTSAKTLGAVTIPSDIDVLNVEGDVSAASLTVSSSTTTNLGMDTTPVTISTTGDQLYNNAVTLTGDTTLEADNVSFEQTVDSDPGERALTVNLTGSGNTIFKGEVGGTGPLGSLDTGANGTVQLGAQEFTLAQGDDLLLNWDAAFDSNGDNFWDTVVNPADANRISFSNVNGTPSDVSDGVFQSLTKAFVFDGTGSGDANSWDGGWALPDSNLSNNTSSLEFILQPDDFTGNHVIWESGGTGVGAVLTLEEVTGSVDSNDDGAYLRLEVRQGSDTFVEHQLTGTNGLGISAGDWLHIVGVFDLAGNELRLYVNGNEAATAKGGFSDFSGGGGAEFADEDGSTPATDTGDAVDGGTGETGPGFSPTPFNGQIAAIRFFDTAFTQADVNQNLTFAQTAQETTISVTTTGAQTFNGAVELGKSPTLNASEVTFGGTLNDDGDATTVSEVTINASTGDVRFDAAVGDSARITSLEANSTTGIRVEGGLLQTEGDATFNGDVRSDTAAVTYDSSLGSFNFNGSLTAVDDFEANAFASVNVAGDADFQALSTFDASDVDLNGTTTLGGDLTATTSNNFFFDGPVVAPSANIITNVNNVTRYADVVEVASIRENITGNFSGRTEFGGDVTFTGSDDNQVDKPILLIGDVTLDATGSTGDLILGPIDSDGSARSLVIDTGTGANTSDLFLNGDIGNDMLGGASGNSGLGNLTLQGDGTVNVSQLANIGGFLNGTTEIPYLNYVAQYEDVFGTAGNAVWEDFGDSATNGDLTLSTAASPVAVTDSRHRGLQAAYDLSGGLTITGNSLQDLTGNLSNNDLSVELWFKDTAGFTGNKVLWESGSANGQGSSITLTDSTLDFRAFENATLGQVLSVDLATLLSAEEQADFIQVMAVYNRDTGGGGNATNDSVALYVNGRLATSQGGLNLDDISSGNDLGVGSQNGGQTGGFTDATSDYDTPFDGQVAIYRVWEESLNGGEVSQAYERVHNPLQVIASGDVTVSSDVALGTSVEIDAGNDITLNNPVNGEQFLGLDAGSVATVNAELGGLQALSEARFDAGSRVDIDTSALHVQGDTDVEFEGPVRLMQDFTVNHTGAGDVQFRSTVDSEATENNDLTVNVQPGQRTHFHGDVGAHSLAPFSEVTGLGDITTSTGATFGQLVTDTASIEFTGDNVNAGTALNTGSIEDFDLPLNGNVTVADGGSAFPGIDRVLSHNGSGSSSFSTLDTLGDTNPMTMEFWVRPDSLSLGGGTANEGEALVESGGSTVGFNVSLINSATSPGTELDVLFTVQDDPANTHIELRAIGAITDLTDLSQLVVTYDPTNAGSGAGVMTIYVNGVAAATRSDASVQDWSGSGDFTLGGPGDDIGGGAHTTPGFTIDQSAFGNFTGDLAAYRFYENELFDAARVDNVFQEISAGAEDGEPVSVTSVGDQTYNGTAELIGDLTTTGANVTFGDDVSLGLHDLAVNVTGVDGTITGDLSGDGSFTKGGNGTLSLNGSSTVAGGNTVTAGVLDGSGTVDGNLTVDAGAELAPGDDGAGTFTVTGDVDLQGDLTVDVAPAGSDQLVIEPTGSLTIGASSEINATGPSGVATNVTVVDNRSAAAIGGAGQFSNLPEDGVLNVGGQPLVGDYLDEGTGNDVTLIPGFLATNLDQTHAFGEGNEGAGGLALDDIVVSGSTTRTPVAPTTTTVYEDDFSDTGALAGQSPDVDNEGTPNDATWTVNGDAWNTDGTAATLTATSGSVALLDFTPEAGQVYTLSADLAITGGAVTDYLALQFRSNDDASPDVSGDGPWIQMLNDPAAANFITGRTRCHGYGDVRPRPGSGHRLRQCGGRARHHAGLLVRGVVRRRNLPWHPHLCRHRRQHRACCGGGFGHRGRVRFQLPAHVREDHSQWARRGGRRLGRLPRSARGQQGWL